MNLIVDPFAGPGGWSEGLRTLGLADVGIELDPAACATRSAAGHRTIQADVCRMPLDHLAGRVEGLIMSPPCQAFSSAGKGDGRAALGKLRTAIDRGDWARRYDGHEVLEVGRWAETLHPRWIACEQVPPVLPLWQAYATRWRALYGWSCWAGLLCAADYGVPQTRTRAILLAHTDGVPAVPPPPTHCRGGADTLFGGLRPWVSMAEALGWDPNWSVGALRGAGQTERHGPRPDRSCAEPAPTVRANGGGNASPGFVLRGGPQAHATIRSIGEPAPTILASADNGGTVWTVRTGANSMVTGRTGSRAGDGDVQPYERSVDRPAPVVDSKTGHWTLHTNRDQRPDGTRQTVASSAPAPAPALTAKAGGQWAWDLPATTIAGDPRITARCHHDDGTQGADAKTTDQVQAGDYEGTEPIKLTLTEALILQSFRPDYPVQGTKTKRFEQVGNAVPPLLAAHVIAAVTGRTMEAVA